MRCFILNCRNPARPHSKINPALCHILLALANIGEMTTFVLSYHSLINRIFFFRGIAALNISQCRSQRGPTFVKPLKIFFIWIVEMKKLANFFKHVLCHCLLYSFVSNENIWRPVVGDFGQIIYPHYNTHTKVSLHFIFVYIAPLTETHFTAFIVFVRYFDSLGLNFYA